MSPQVDCGDVRGPLSLEAQLHRNAPLTVEDGQGFPNRPLERWFRMLYLASGQRHRLAATSATATGCRQLSDADRIVEVDVLDGPYDPDPLGQGALEGLASHDEAHAAGPLVYDRCPHGLGEVAGAF